MKNINKILLISSICTSLFSQTIYTVDELIIKALELSPDLKIGSYQYKTSKSQEDEASGNYLPRVDANAGLGYVGVSDIPLNHNDTKSDSTIIGQLTLKQLLYDFGKTGGNVDSLKYSTNALHSNYEQLISDKKRDVKEAYYNVLKAKSLIKVNIENVKLNEAQLYRSQKYFEAGIRTKIDVSDAKVELIKAKLDLKKAEYNLKLAYTNLDKIVGFSAIKNDYKVYYKASDINTLSQALNDYGKDLVDSIKFAYENRFVLKQYLQLIKASKAKEKFTTSSYYPEFYLDASYKKQDVGNELKDITPENSWQGMINMNWNLYEGGSNSAREQTQKIQTKISNSQYLYAKLNVKTEVTNAYINLNKVKDSVILSQSLLNASKEKFAQAEKRYEYGLSDYIELQQARQGYIDSAASLIIDYYDYFVAIAILDKSIGK